MADSVTAPPMMVSEVWSKIRPRLSSDRIDKPSGNRIDNAGLHKYLFTLRLKNPMSYGDGNTYPERSFNSFTTRHIIEIRNFRIDNHMLRMFVQLPYAGDLYNFEIFSEIYLLYGFIKFQIRANEIKKTLSSKPFYLVFVKFENTSKNNSISINLSALDIQKLTFFPDSSWHLIYEASSPQGFDICLMVEIGHANNQTKTLYDDEELTDFELRGSDCTVKVHKCILATASPILKALLSQMLGECKEAKNRYLEMKDISKAALEDFKTYIYSQPLPSTVSEQLLILAMRFEMPDMETACINILIQNMTAEKSSDLLDFAVTHKNAKLKTAILENIRNGTVNLDNIKKHLIDKDEYNIILIPSWEALGMV